MFVVGVVELATSIEVEAAALAAALGTTLYEERLNLAAGLPAIVLATTEEQKAPELLAGLSSRGHRAFAFDSADVVSSSDMVSMRHVRLEGDGLATVESAAQPGGFRLPFADILAIVRATHQTRTETVSTVTEKKFGAGRALLTGGLLLTKKVTREETSVTHGRDAVLYVFRRSAERPWLLRERSANYQWLGPTLAPSSAQNFLTAAKLLRERAPGAVYDEQLVTVHRGVGRTTRTAASSTHTNEPIVDLLAHLIALSHR